MHLKNTITQLLLVLSLASLSICHIIRRDAIEDTSVAIVTGEPSPNELAPLEDHPNDLTEDYLEEQEELTNELGYFQQQGESEETHDVSSEEDDEVETSLTSHGDVTYHDVTTTRHTIPGTVEIETSSSNETAQAQTAITEQPQIDVLPSTNATSTTRQTIPGTVQIETSTSYETTQAPMGDVLPRAISTSPHGSSTSAPNDEEFSLHSEPCYEPPAQRLHLSFKQNNQNVKFPALAILKKENFDEESNQTGDDESTGEPQGQRDYVNMTCPTELLHVSNHDDVSMRSLCPWTYVADVDPNRYPSRIMFAVCRCPECIRTGSGENGEFSVDNTCRPVYFRMKVLMKGNCVNGLYVYNTEYQRIPVACACVRPKI
ncbi:uncharacterized protein LOC117299708 [Asterias rubens]|uniref:uncharacterized protein LOC117299708 n=1 Tax=Asterias rubens TaxID=7604 RepID=UPI00145577B0|nr:uncharacterized protein LOC117299708 [Asterias rubens]